MLKNKKIISSIIILLAIVLCTGSFVYFNNKKDNKKETTYLSASWAYNYSDIEEISQASDLIALVTVKGVENTTVENNIPYTTFSAEVNTPVYNSNEGEKLSIYMTGGETTDSITELKDDPLLQKGDEILVFCKKNTDGTYQIISGPQGRLVYTNGKLNSLNVINTRVKQENPYSNIKIQNADAAALISEIKGYVNNN